MLRFSSDIQYLKGVGEARAKLFRRLGVDNIGSLVRLFPRAYEYWSKVTTILGAVPGEQCCIKAMVCSPVTHALIRKGMTIYKTQATDGENIMKITIFNNRFAAEKLEEGEEYVYKPSTFIVSFAATSAEGADFARTICEIRVSFYFAS